MKTDIITPQFAKDNLNIPNKNSHKGQNGKVAIIGGSKLFHGASLWALKIASRIVDMVYYLSVPENFALTEFIKRNLYSFINVPRGKEDEYLVEADSILIGPGMVRGSTLYTGTGESGKQTRKTTLDFFAKFPDKQWVVDAGALQAIDVSDLKKLKQPIITPHQKEFIKIFRIKDFDFTDRKKTAHLVCKYAKLIDGIILLKGKVDIICDSNRCIINKTGNVGMTKGGTGDVLAGLVVALASTHSPFEATALGAYFNGLAGDYLYKHVGPYFNADDLCNYVPEIMWGEVK